MQHLEATSRTNPSKREKEGFWSRLWWFFFGRFSEERSRKRQQEGLLLAIDANRITIERKSKEIEELQRRELDLLKKLPTLKKHTIQWTQNLKEYQSVEKSQKNNERIIETCYANIETQQALIDSMAEKQAVEAIKITSQDIITVQTETEEARNQQQEVVLTGRVIKEMNGNSGLEMDHSENEQIEAQMLLRKHELEDEVQEAMADGYTTTTIEEAEYAETEQYV